jgi:hypothetical protein
MPLLCRSTCGENGTLYPSQFTIPEMVWDMYGAPCSCDPLCAHYKDCCHNSEYFVPEDQVWGASPQTCFSPRQDGSYFNMKKSCPVNWDDDGTRSNCQGDTDFPLTSSRTHVSYSNMYCALCNGDFDTHTDILWPTRYYCSGDDFFGYDLQITSGENDTTVVNITFWNITHSDEFHYRFPVNSFDFVHSHFVPAALAVYDPHSTPNFIRSEDEYRPTEHNTELRGNAGNYTCHISSYVLDKSIMRRCSQVIGTCASDWTDSDVEAKCLAYTDVYCHYIYFYRNPYCAHCNHENLSQTISCSVMRLYSPKSDFSWMLKWDFPDYGKSEGENDTSVEDVHNGKITLIFISRAHPRPMHGYLPRKRRD